MNSKFGWKDFSYSVIFALLLFIGIFTVPGCSSSTLPAVIATPEQQKEVASQAGSLATSIFLAVESNDPDEIAAVKTVIDLLSTSITNYQEGGFIAAKDKLALLINQQVPVKYQPVANSLAGSLLTALDNLFAKHPEWKADSTQVTAVISSFFSGAQSSFATVKSAREMKRSMAKPAN